MIRYLVDTNILLRWSQPHHALYALLRAAIAALRTHGDDVYVTPQNLIEFWNAATRPLDRNGFGYTPERAAREIANLAAFFLLAPDNASIYPEWLRIVTTVGVSGVQVHDARLVAVMRVYAITHLLTLNPTDFTRYSGIVVVHPQDLVPTP